MRKQMKLKTKMIAWGIVLTLLPLLLVVVMTFVQNVKMVDAAQEETEKLAFTNLDNIVSGVYAACKTQDELIRKEIENSLRVAHDIVEKIGPISFSDETCTWEAVNQYTKKASTVNLPKMYVGDAWLGKNASMQQTSPVVDKVQGLVDATCTIFQRMNDNGDMLRVCTNVEKTGWNTGHRNLYSAHQYGWKP